MQVTLRGDADDEGEDEEEGPGEELTPGKKGVDPRGKEKLAREADLA